MPTAAVPSVTAQCRPPEGQVLTLPAEDQSRLFPTRGSQQSSAPASSPTFTVSAHRAGFMGPRNVRVGWLCSRSPRSALGQGGEDDSVQNDVCARVRGGVSLLHTQCTAGNEFCLGKSRRPPGGGGV